MDREQDHIWVVRRGPGTPPFRLADERAVEVFVALGWGATLFPRAELSEDELRILKIHRDSDEEDQGAEPPSGTLREKDLRCATRIISAARWWGAGGSPIPLRSRLTILSPSRKTSILRPEPTEPIP